MLTSKPIKRGNSTLKRTGFKKRPFPASVSLSDVQAAESTKRVLRARLTQKRPIRAIGRRGKEWQRVWAWLKPRLERAHRTKCEFGFIPHDCFGPLDPTHSKKRREMEGNDIYAVAIACRNIHRVLDEVYTHKAMELAVTTAINRSGGLILPNAE